MRDLGKIVGHQKTDGIDHIETRFAEYGEVGLIVGRRFRLQNFDIRAQIVTRAEQAAIGRIVERLVAQTADVGHHAQCKLSGARVRVCANATTKRHCACGRSEQHERRSTHHRSIVRNRACGSLLGYYGSVPELQAKDLRVTPPRRWSDELGGIRWLPRMIDKARAAMHGTLGDYLYGQSPMDRSLLRAMGLSYKDFTRIVRQSGGDDDRVLEALQEQSPDGLQLARRWSDALPRRRAFLFFIDLDDGYYGGPLQSIRGVIRFLYGLIVLYIRYRWPAKGALKI